MPASLAQSEVTRFCQGTGVQVKAFQGSRLDHANDQYVKLDFLYLHGDSARKYW